VKNTGSRAGVETVQLYVRDAVASIVRPVKELKAFRRIHLRPGESKIVEFALQASELGFYDDNGELKLEPGTFRVGVGGDSSVELTSSFEVISSDVPSARSPAPVARDGEASPGEARDQRANNESAKAGS
jgi:beta-glucosidase